MERKKSDLLLIVLPILAIFSVLFVFTQKSPADFLDISFKDQEEVKNVSSERAEVENTLYFKSVDEHLAYLRKKVNEQNGVFGLFVKDIKTGEEYLINARQTFYGASLYKLPVAVAILKEVELGKMSLQDLITFTASDHTTGTGSIEESSYGTKYTIEQVLNYLTRHSDNSGQAMLERLLGEVKVREAFSALVINPQINEFYHENITSAENVGYVIENIFYGEYLGKQSQMRLLNLMSPTLFDDRVTPFLKEGLTFAHKIGSWSGSWHDCGLVYNDQKEIIVCLMSENTNYSSFLSVAEYVGGFVNSLF